MGETREATGCRNLDGLDCSVPSSVWVIPEELLAAETWMAWAVVFRVVCG